MAYSRENNIRWFNNVMAIWTAFNGEMVSEIWRPSTFPTKGSWNKIVFGAKNFVASSLYPAALAYSDDKGRTWKSASFPGYAERVYELYACGEALVCSYEKYESDKKRYAHGIFCSTDDGKTWEEASLSDSTWQYNSEFGCFCFGDGAVLAMRFQITNPPSGEIVRSTDGGRLWNNVESGPYASSIAYGNGRFMTAGYGKTSCSTDGGKTWTNLRDVPWSTPYTGDGSENLLVYAGNGRFCYVSGEHVLFSDGGDWEESSTPPDFKSGMPYGGHGILCPGETELLYYEKDSGYLYKSANGGDTWEELESIGSDIKSIAYGNGMFVAVGFTPDCCVIKEGEPNIEYENIPTKGWIYGTNWEAVAYGDGHFAAASYGGMDVADDPYRFSNRAAYRI